MGNSRVNRIKPKLPAAAMRTYAAVSPLTTHFRKATCEEANCLKYRDGWRVSVETLRSMPDGAALLDAVKRCGKKFTLMEISATENWLVFEPGQNCFDGDAGRHRIRSARPELFIVKEGDWRGNPRGEPPVVMDGEEWKDRMQNNRDELITRLEQG